MLAFLTLIKFDCWQFFTPALRNDLRQIQKLPLSSVSNERDFRKDLTVAAMGAWLPVRWNEEL